VTYARFAALLALAACGYQSQYMPTNPPPRPMQARAPETVELFTASGKPSRPYVEVGILQTRQGDGESGYLPHILDAMREEAAKIGCDALVVNGASPEVVGGEEGTRTYQGFWGACILYVQDVATLE
jgi:hypothetical protein